MRWIVALAILGACARQATPPSRPSFEPVRGHEAPPHAALYADCIAQAAANRTYRRAHDPDTDILLFTCTGAPARAFYDELAAWSARIGSEVTYGGRTIRSTTKVRQNLFGVDYCASRGDQVECIVTLNAGEFLAP